MLVSTSKILHCPICRHNKLTLQADRANHGTDTVDDGLLLCIACGESFPIRHGIPILLRRDLLISEADTRFADLDRTSRQKVLQRQWHDRAHLDEADYKLASYCSETLFAYFLYYQMREIESFLRGQRYERIASSCSGHGFELEFLSLFGKQIFAFDISCPSLLKTVEMGRKLGVSVEAICCDAEDLPLQDGQFDLVLTHHSLHHLANPWRGLQESVRISRRHCVFFEPAKGVMRSVITKLGLKPRIEESGNVVYEFGKAELEEFCHRYGLQLRLFRKDLITGPVHEPKFFRRLDSLGISLAICHLVRLGNFLAGSLLGTKCSVVIEKEAAFKTEETADAVCPVSRS
jgi:uncharacterized protein YbaR (Trm112 family)